MPPFPSPFPSEEPPSAARAHKAGKEVLHPAVAAYQNCFERLKGRKPARNKSLESRAVAIWNDQGEETYHKALEGFFGCLGGTDAYPQTKGFDLAIFVRQFDTWEGGAVQKPLVPLRVPLNTSRPNVDPNRTLQDVADEIMARHTPDAGVSQ